MADTTETVILEFTADTVPLEQALDKVQQELTDLAKTNPQFAKGVAQGMSAATKEMSKQAIAAGEDKKKVDALANSLNNLAKGIAGQAAKQLTQDFQKFGTQITDVAKKSTSLQQELRKLRAELAGLDESSDQFAQLSIEAARLEDKIGDVNQRIRVMASDTFAIDALVDGVRGVTAAFTFAQSAAALFGEENEDLQKALLKVQAATGLLVSVQEIANQVTGQGAAKLAIISGAQKAYKVVTDAATAATRAFGAATVGLGFGAVIAALVAIVTYWEDIKKAIGLANDARDDWDDWKEKEKSRKEYFSKLDEHSKKILEFEALEREAAEGGIAQIRRTIMVQEELGASEERLYSLKQILRRKELEELKKQEESIKNLRGASYIDQQNALNQIAIAIADKEAEIFAALKKPFQDFKDDAKKNPINIGDVITFDPNARTFDDDIKDLVKQIEEEFKKDPPKVGIALEVPQTAFDDLRDQLLQQERDEIERKRDKDRQIKEFAIQSAQETFDAIFQIASENRAREEQAELEALDRKRQAELDSVELRAEQGVITQEQARNRQLAIEEKYRQKEAQIRQKTFQAQQQAAIAQAAINAALAITQIFATVPPVIPGTIVPNPQLPIALAAAAFATGLQIALIESRKPPAFAKGTKSAPGGMALVGEEGAELMYVPQGAKVIPHAQTAKVLSGHPDSNEILSRFNIPITSARIDELRADVGSFDYKRFESIISKHSKGTSFNIDKNGIYTIVDDKSNQRQYYADRYKSI